MKGMLVFFFLSLSITASLHAQVDNCDIQVDVRKGCVPQPINFKPLVPDSTKVSSYFWDFDDGTNSSQQNSNHIYNKSGIYTPTLIVYYKDGSFCQKKMTIPIRIYSKPTADFSPAEGEVILCNPNDKICFKDLSKTGAEGSKITSWLWTFGDGGFSQLKEPCYTYGDSGYYQVTLEVTDTNGCRSPIVKKLLHVRYADNFQPLEPKFKADYSYDCQNNRVSLVFHNKTDTAGKDITKFVWNYDDGTVDSCDLRDPNCADMWKTRVHLYQHEGEYEPSLTIYNKYGCAATYGIDTPVNLFHYYFDVNVSPDKLCLSQDPSIFFEVTGYLPSNTFYYWDFNGDNEWDANVPYYFMKKWQDHFPTGVYTVRLRIEYDKCVFDTIMCNKIEAYDAYARILKPGALGPEKAPPNGSWYVDPVEYSSFFDTACTSPDTVVYYTYDSTYVVDGLALNKWCPPEQYEKKTRDRYDCSLQKYTEIYYVPKPKSIYKDTVKVTATPHEWVKGDPWPLGEIFSEPPFYDDPLLLNDTMLVAPNCSAPRLIKFTNFSGKDRGYFAYDNNALTYDTCLSPGYPFATDSLRYYWTFQEGNGQVSTPGGPEDIRASFSRLKTPTHLFMEDGCYWVRLDVMDTITGCTHMDMIPVVLQEADAGWAPEYDSIDTMTWLIQESLPPKGPRRGFRLKGNPCVGDTQYIELDETLPSCYKVDFAIVFDSSDYVLDKCAPNGLKPRWYNKSSVDQAQYKFIYPDTGWRTMALTVRNNENCIDTVWYPRYKYFHDVNPSVRQNANIFCLGDSLKITPADPAQLGIQTMRTDFIFTRSKYDTIEVRRDTFNYEIHTIGDYTDTITTTVHNEDWGKYDSNLNYNYLYDTLGTLLNHPGHVTVYTRIYNRFGCKDSTALEITVGNSSNFISNSSMPCLGDTISFYESISYYVPFYQNENGYDTTQYWKDPVGKRNGRVPALPEKVEWDFNGDSIIDATGPEPKWVYSKPGTYTVRMFTTDSLGCKQVLEKKDFIHVLQVQAKFVVDSPGANRFCAPHFYHFIDSSRIFPDNVSKVGEWIWDFGDGSAPLVITDPSKRDPIHLYEHNGTYTVSLKVKTPDGTGVNVKGCTDSFAMTFTIKGPSPEFEAVGEMEGCVPFTLKLVDKTKSAAVREWYLGDGNVYKSEGEDTIYLTYNTPGEYCPYLVAVDTVLTLQGDTLYCLDTFPKPACKYKVRVHGTNEIHVTPNDTVLCVNSDPLDLKISPDTGYTSWKIEYGDGRTETSDKPAFKTTYDRTGKYRLRITGMNGRCPDTAYLDIRVVDVEAGFEIDEMNIDTPFFNFINTSRNGVMYVWSFSDGQDTLVLNKDDILHEFIQAGEQTICLTATNAEGCTHKVCKKVNLLTDLFIPNVFTPDNDPQRYNEQFVIDILGELDYGLKIYNRWGELVFESENKYDTWDGTDRKTGKEYPNGTYYFVFTYRLIGEPEKVAKGTVTLLR